METPSSNNQSWNDTAARMTVIVALLVTLGFGAVLFEIDLGRVHPVVHMGFFAGLCVFLAALTALLACGARGDLERRASDEGASGDTDADRPRV